MMIKKKYNLMGGFIEMIRLSDTSKGDSRTSGANPSLKDIKKATITHIQDVDNALSFWIKLLEERQGNHDWSKLENFEEEYGYLVTNNVKNEEFLASDWWNKHITQERHHINFNERLAEDAFNRGNEFEYLLFHNRKLVLMELQFKIDELKRENNVKI